MRRVLVSYKTVGHATGRRIMWDGGGLKLTPTKWVAGDVGSAG